MEDYFRCPQSTSDKPRSHSLHSLMIRHKVLTLEDRVPIMQLLAKNRNKMYISSPHASQRQATLTIPTKDKCTSSEYLRFWLHTYSLILCREDEYKQCCQGQNTAKCDTINHLH